MQTNHVAAALLLAAFSGCEKQDPLFCQMNPGASGCATVDGDVAQIDGGPDIDAPPTDARVCFGTGDYTLCLAAPPSQQRVLNAGTFDTTDNAVCLSPIPADWTTGGQPDACIVVGTSIIVPNLDVIGSRPLVLLASQTIQINGVLDVSSRRAGTPKVGPGSPAADCGTPTDTPDNSGNGGGGGAGGSFITPGGAGGGGNNDNTSGGAAVPNLTEAPATLRAGCPGQAGGTGEGGSDGGALGAGGGAVYLVAGATIAFASDASINASGAGAGKANRQSGGGGGGSGGMIVLDAPAISAGANVTLAANGGSGSSGGNDNNNCGCMAGNDPNPADPLTGAAGGSGGGGAGGNGFAQGAGALAGGNAGSNLGGGGGGGGGGYIRSTIALDANITASPTPVVL